MKALIAIVVIVILCYVAHNAIPQQAKAWVIRHGRNITFFVSAAILLAMIAYFSPINPYFQP
jgi:hypothetical protein